MPIVSAPLCPNCQGAVDLEPLWKVAATNRQNHLIGEIGIRCLSCGARLRIARARASWGSFALMGLMLILFGVCADRLASTGRFSPNVAFGIMVVPLLALGFGISRDAPRLVSLRLAHNGEQLAYSLERVGI